MVSKAAILPLILTATSLAFFTLIHLFVFLSIQGFLAQRSLFSRCFHSNGGDGVGELEKETQRKKKSKNLGAITVFKLEKKKKSRTESWEREQWWLLERRYNCCYSLREVFPEPSEQDQHPVTCVPDNKISPLQYLAQT